MHKSINDKIHPKMYIEMFEGDEQGRGTGI